MSIDHKRKAGRGFPALAADGDLRRAWATVLPRRRTPAEAVTIARRLTADLPPDHADQIVATFLYGTYGDDAQWKPPLEAWRQAATLILPSRLSTITGEWKYSMTGGVP